jgi:spermine oxidase
MIKYNADFVLVTIPLGVLKQNYKSLFRPNLPFAKANAIEKLGFGTVNKVFAVYEKPFFPEEDQGLRLIWRADLQNISNLPYSDQKCNLMVGY